MPAGKKSPESDASGKTADSHCPQTITHTEYYKEGGDLWVLITPTYFRLHSSFFVEGSDMKFFEKKTTPPGAKLVPGEPLPGTGRPENAILIETEATVEEFCLFLGIIYNPLIDDYSRYKLEDWFTVLRLAHEWGFDIMKAMALRYIDGKVEQELPDLVERIVRYEQFAPPAETLIPLYVELCTRTEYPTDEECEKLGESRALKVHRAREKLLRVSKRATGRPTSSEVKDIVCGLMTLTPSPGVPVSATKASETRDQAATPQADKRKDTTVKAPENKTQSISAPPMDTKQDAKIESTQDAKGDARVLSKKELREQETARKRQGAKEKRDRKRAEYDDWEDDVVSLEGVAEDEADIEDDTPEENRDKCYQSYNTPGSAFS